MTVDLRVGRGGAEGEADSLVGFEDVTGGLGSDRLLGDAGPNVIYGGRTATTGARLRRGRHPQRAPRVRRAGEDLLDGKLVGCGGGADLIARLRFHPAGPYGRACERVRPFFYNVTRPRLADGKLRFDFSCPVRRCSGKFVLRDRRGELEARKYAALGRASAASHRSRSRSRCHAAGRAQAGAGRARPGARARLVPDQAALTVSF